MKDKEYIQKLLAEYKVIYEALMEKYEFNRKHCEYNPDSIEALEKVKHDEGGNSNYYCGTLYGKIEVLEEILGTPIEKVV